MLLLTLLCLCWNFLSKIAHLLFHTLFTPLWLFYCFKTQVGTEGKKVEWHD
jgi:hypothetical protein